VRRELSLKSVYCLAELWWDCPTACGFEGTRIDEVYMAALVVGDCNMDINSHHGTPAQRERAAMFGANLVHKKGKWERKQTRRRGEGNQTKPSGIVSSENFGDLFDLSLSLIDDADVCSYHSDRK
jgi:hypothetical protein